MVYCCIPLCRNGYRRKQDSSGLKFHRFPPDEIECKKWIKLIRRKDFVWTMNSVICSWHFPFGKQNGPTRFHWNEKKDFTLNGLGDSHEFSKRRKRKPMPVLNGIVRGEMAMSEEKLAQLTQEITKLKQELIESKQMIVSLGVDNDIGKHENKKLLEKLNFYQKFEPETMELKAKIKNLENLYRLKVKKKIPTFTADIEEWDGTLISSFTGLQSWSSINFLMKALELYGINYKNTNVLCLSLKDQVVLFLMKLRLDLSNNVLSKLFNISSATVSRIFETILNATNEFYYDGDGPLTKIPTIEKTLQSLPRCFIKDMSNCRIVIDCTEFEMEAPKQMNQKKLTFSSYKSRYTMKSLIGCSPNGVPVFISDLYGGSLSDKGIVLASGLLQQLSSGDLILADKGFELYDVLPPGVALNIPSFLSKNQFTLNKTIQNRAISRARIIIERLNARFKIFKILSCIKAGSRNKANMLVKVCVALTTLMPTLMDELNEIE